MSELKLKLVVVGDGAVGKTCLLVSFAENRFPEEYVPVFDNYAVEYDVNQNNAEKKVILEMWDTAGQEDYDRLSVDSMSSYENVTKKWMKELDKESPDPPIILLGLKSDLRKDEEFVHQNGERFVTIKEGQDLAKKIAAQKYKECSAKSRDGIKDVFSDAMLAGLDFKENGGSRSDKKCSIL